jgi:AcrR family transcriptional regulator
MSDRRQQRRRQSIDEVVSAALEVMAETGAAGLSLGEVAKRTGMRTPSLYGYFASKAALCDEIFARGWAEVAELMTSSYEELAEAGADDLYHQVARHLRRFVGWALEHRAQAELMFWRPIPRWEPAADSYAAAVDLLAQMHGALGALQERGLLRRDVPVESVARVLTVLSTGVISQQLSNEPGVPLARGSYAIELDRLAGMFLREFGSGQVAAPTEPGMEPGNEEKERVSR